MRRQAPLQRAQTLDRGELSAGNSGDKGTRQTSRPRRKLRMVIAMLGLVSRRTANQRPAWLRRQSHGMTKS